MPGVCRVRLFRHDDGRRQRWIAGIALKEREPEQALGEVTTGFTRSLVACSNA